MTINNLVNILQQKIDKIKSSGNSQNICGSCYDDGRVEAYEEVLDYITAFNGKEKGHASI